jgi:hypothetical protein
LAAPVRGLACARSRDPLPAPCTATAAAPSRGFFNRETRNGRAGTDIGVRGAPQVLDPVAISVALVDPAAAAGRAVAAAAQRRAPRGCSPGGPDPEIRHETRRGKRDVHRST